MSTNTHWLRLEVEEKGKVPPLAAPYPSPLVKPAGVFNRLQSFAAVENFAIYLPCAISPVAVDSYPIFFALL